jgi:hypothetical protein
LIIVYAIKIVKNRKHKKKIPNYEYLFKIFALIL